MLLKKKFLILTSDSGFGHRSAANAIAKALTIQHPLDSTAIILNPIFEEPVSPWLMKAEQNYDHFITKNSALYRFAYEISDSRPASGILEKPLTLALSQNIKKIVKELSPDAILSTNQMFNAPTGTVLGAIKNRPPFFTVVTDLASVHSMWFNANPDRFFVASEMVRRKAIACGVDSGKICISGIPVDPDYALKRAKKSELRLEFGLDPWLPLLLVVVSQRVSGVLEHLSALKEISHPFQVVFIAGGDNDLYEKVCYHEWPFPIRVLSYVTNMPDWMLCADLLISKAGGLILSEGLAAGLPILMIDYLPGQEVGNVRFILDHQAGVLVNKPVALGYVVNEWLKLDQKSRRVFAENARQCGRPGSALVIADAIWQTANNKVNEIRIPYELSRSSHWYYPE